MIVQEPQKKDFIIEKEGMDNILKIDYSDVPRIPSIEDDPLCMARVCDHLISSPNITKVAFHQKHDYEYDYSQIKLLIEIAKVYKKLVKQKELFSYQSINSLSTNKTSYDLSSKYNEINNILFNYMKKDPVGCFVELKRILRREKIDLDKEINKDIAKSKERYIELIEYISQEIENTSIIQISIPYLAGHKVGSREIYRNIFSPEIKPDFMFTRIMASYPEDGEEVMNYNLGDTEVVIFKLPDTIQYLYHLTPPEFKLSEDKYEILDQARKIMAEHQPEEQDFVNPKRMREVFKNIGSDLLEELATQKNLKLTNEDLEELTNILIRYTVGFGIIEVLLMDDYIQDIAVNSPAGQIPMYVVHGKFDECKTNIVPSPSDQESWASKLRLLSGRPLDEANPILDTDIEIPGIASARVGVISRPLNPTGVAYSFRRHRDKPWTLPLFIKNGMITSLGAGLISFLVDGNRTFLVAGTRSAGKSSFLGSLLVEIMRKYRILTIEDTLELPTNALRDFKYNIQTMKVASALSKGTNEVPADEGIRTTLRLGDSALIVGEVRSTEARALYEAMRVGALANVVAGTIHGDSPYGVYDRVVNDLNVPRTSFKATDIIIVANPIRSADGLHRWRRITQITEVRKDWEKDPLREKGFVDLMKYNSETDSLEPTENLLNGDSEIIKAIAGNVKEWAGDWDAVWDNILLRAKIKQAIVDTALEQKNDSILEAGFVIGCNDQFHKISDEVKEETGKLDSKKIFAKWHEWLKLEIKKLKLSGV